MARLLATVNIPSTALTAATAKTVVQLAAPTNQRVVVKKLSLCFDGATPAAAPVQVRILRQTTAGTMSAATPALVAPGPSETIQTTASTNATAEPTAGTVLGTFTIHPQSGLVYIPPLYEEPVINGGSRLGVECNAPAGVNVRGFIEFEE